jgi:hypothetical protein
VIETSAPLSPPHVSQAIQQSIQRNRTSWTDGAALGRIAVTRMDYDPRTRDYIGRRTKDGLTKKDAFRCLKRYIAREV